MAKISIAIPVYQMENWREFLTRCINSIISQDFKDYEIVISDDSEDNRIEMFSSQYPVRYIKNTKHGMAENTNNAINNSSGELIKILYQDDLFHDTGCLSSIVRHFTPSVSWLVTGCTHSFGEGGYFNPHFPYYSYSENTIGSPSVVTIRNTIKERFDPKFSWVLDLDLYRRLVKKHGKPKILEEINVVIGIGAHQTTHKLTDIQKLNEYKLLKNKKYG